MFEEALAASRRIFRVPRSQQQMPHFPLLFGAYDIPTPRLRFMQRFAQTSLLHEADSLFCTLLKCVTKQVSNKDTLGLELRLSCEENERLMANRRVRAEERESSKPTETCLLAKRMYRGPFVPVKALNPKESDLMSTPFLKDLNNLNTLYESLENRYGSEVETDIDYLMQGLNQEALVKKLRAGKVLSPFELEQLCILHLHCGRVGMMYEEALVAVRHAKKVVIVSDKGEEVDGEIESNVHILLLRKASPLSQSNWLRKHFPLDRILLADVDFLLNSANLSNGS